MIAPGERWLLLIDCRQEVAVSGLPCSAPHAPSALQNITRLLTHARASAWPVFHALRARSTRQEYRGPIQGLEPLSSEPVLRCASLSVFSVQAFRNVVEQEGPAELLIAGFGLGDMGLATLVAAYEAGASVTLVEDAVAAAPIGDRTATEIERVTLALATRFARVATTNECLAESGGKLIRLGEAPMSNRGVNR